ncbi:MAG: cytochrome C [Proteobacteria bacterium]|nr:cytochrome C [Pseudomonadota bacterium]
MIGLSGIGISVTAQAVPSFARQTGLACMACHTQFPELTPFGRQFKLNGYVADNMKQIQTTTLSHRDLLLLNQTPPLSLMFQASVTRTSKALPDSAVTGALAQNGQAQFPQQASLFYAGRIAPKLGAFIQMTYDAGSGSWGMDNTDIRFADRYQNPLLASSKPLVWGLTLNNNPTVQDVWNSTPGWGFPYGSPSAAPGSVASPLLDGTLAGDVGGLGAYVWWNNWLYAEITGYRTARQGATGITGQGPLDSGDSNVISGIAPYWRIAAEKDWGPNALEVGLLGMDTRLLPGGTGTALSGPTNNFNDIGMDTQYQWITEHQDITLQGRYIHESQTLGAAFASGGASNLKDKLNELRLTASYLYAHQIGGTFGFFNTTGTSDAALYPSGSAYSGSANNSPDTRGYVAELDYLPWLNTKFSLQYTMYTKFNGGSSNYDGLGRSASDNNTLYLLGWFNF